MPSAPPRLLLGIDAGGACTDAALLDEGRAARALAGEGAGADSVLASAKALTTRPDLSIGVGNAVRAALDAAGADPSQIALAGLSTTLATNALVEGQGDPAALIAIGFSPDSLAREGIADALHGAPLIVIAGGHAAGGDEAAPLDLAALEAALPQLVGMSGVAVAAAFSIRNPAHEIAVRDLIRARTGLPVTCSHELSARIGGPRRALTALLNARLIGMIDRLIAATRAQLPAMGIHAPLMIVRGDGALMDASLARLRPIETILSGPAASALGAAFLAGEPDALIADMGGTTTDVAVLRNGRPRLSPDGAQVGGWRTMVEAAAIRTEALGGDGEVRVILDGGGPPRLTIGPRRAAPLALLGADPAHGARIRAALAAQLAGPRVREDDGVFLLALGPAPTGLDGPEAALMARLAFGPTPIGDAAPRLPDRRAADRLAARGLIRRGAFTPTDAAHALGLQTNWDTEAAAMGAALMARRRDARGAPAWKTPEAAAQAVLTCLRRRWAETALAVVADEDGLPGADLAASAFAQAAMDGHSGLMRPSLSLSIPMIAVGGPAALHGAEAAALIGARAVIPPHAASANAVGAVAGPVRASAETVATRPDGGGFRLHLASGAETFDTLDAVRARAHAALSRAATDMAVAAGADPAALSIEITDTLTSAAVEGQDMVVEVRFRADAIGRPRLATPG
jgi:N-methylhydantoinase A/oxoprolinase/acetone carboxylase beta subunit